MADQEAALPTGADQSEAASSELSDTGGKAQAISQPEQGDDDDEQDLALPLDIPKGMSGSGQIRSFMSLVSRYGPMPSPLVKKITSEHISAVIESNKEARRLEYEDAKLGRRYSVVYCLAGVGLFIFLVVFLGSSSPDLLKELLGYVIALVGGFGTGYGYRSLRERGS